MSRNGARLAFEATDVRASSTAPIAIWLAGGWEVAWFGIVQVRTFTGVESGFALQYHVIPIEKIKLASITAVNRCHPICLLKRVCVGAITFPSL